MSHMRSRQAAVILSCCFILAGCSSEQAGLPTSLAIEPAMAAGAKSITSFPAVPNKACRNGRAKLYDECADQLALLAAAKARAAQDNKVLLVAYGAEWCIWCHVFAEHIYGRTGRFSYTYGSAERPDARQTSTLDERAARDVKGDAAALNTYVADNFVVVHIDAQYAPNGRKVLEVLDAGRLFESWIPFVFTVGRNGKAVASFSHRDVEVRRDTADWYRGYDRVTLLRELKRMREAAK